MAISFENNNDVIVYALEKILSYARDNHYIFLGQSILWILSIIEFQQGLVIHIDNLKERSDIAFRDTTPRFQVTNIHIATSWRSKEVSPTSWDIQEDSRSYNESGYIHPDIIPQVLNTIHDISDLQPSSSSTDQHPRIIQQTERFIQKSRKDREQLKKKIDALSRTRSGNILAKQRSKKQRSYLQSIPKNTIANYLDNRK